MANYLTSITNHLWTQSWQIAILAVIIAIMSILLKNKSAHIRYLLWLILLVKCFVPPLLTIPLAILPQEQITQPIIETAAKIPSVFVGTTKTNIDEPGITLLTSLAEPTIFDTLSTFTLSQWLGFAWILGVIIFALVALIKALRVNRWLKKERKPLAANLQQRIRDLFDELNEEKFPRVWLVDGIGQPFVWGLLRGSIYLPSDFAEIKSEEHRRGILSHELSHVIRFDAGVNLLQIIAQAIFWFHPLVWWANKKIRAEREKCCDEMAIAALGTKARDFSTAIVNLLTVEHKSTQPIPSLAVAGPVKNIEDRIKTIMNPSKKFYSRPSILVAITILLIAIIAVPTTLALTSKPAEKADVQGEADREALTAEQLVLKLVDNSGKPVVGAKVGTNVRTRDEQVLSSKLSWYLSGKEKPVSDENGQIVLIQNTLFPKSWNPDRKRALYILNEEQQIGAFCEISKDDERNQIELTLEPVCHVHGKLSSKDLEEIGRPLKWSNVYLSFNKDSHGVLSCMSEEQQFDFWVPPGEYKLNAYGSGDGVRTKHSQPIIEVETGQSELDIGVVDLPATKLSTLIGKSAPEIGPIRAWKNGSPVKLSELHGKPVILHFGGGYPSTSRDLPRLVELHEGFHDVGLEIIAIYNCESMEQLEQRFRDNSEKYGGASNVPFRLAVDGGEGRSIEGTDRTIPGATYAVYEISTYNTTILIDSKRKVVEELNLSGAKEKLEDMLGVEINQTVSNWRQRFNEVYRLEDGQILKRIAPPFIPERVQYYKYEHSHQAEAISSPPDRFVFHWNGKLKNWGLSFGRKSDLASILDNVLRMQSFEYEGPEELLSIRMLEGDWIIRDEVSQEAKLKTLEQLIAEEFGRDIQFEKRTVKRQVIVATGNFKFLPLSMAPKKNRVYMFSDKFEPDAGGGGGTAKSVTEFLTAIGNRVGVPVIDETEGAKEINKMPYDHHRSAYLHNVKDKAEKTEKLQMLLANITEQTKLQFVIEQQPVEIWFATEQNKDK